jgi:phosphatidylinositol alpha-1,6-mannosyltransferase
MTPAFRSVLLTPNLLGADGVSCLSRQIARALPGPVLVISLHDAPASARAQDPGENAPPRRSAGGSRLRFIADALGAGLRCDRRTVIVCSHVHLAPIARLVAWRSAPALFVLCGIEAWVPLRAAERWALSSGSLVAISQHTVRRFKAANPAFESTAVAVCHPGLPPRPSGVDAARDPAGEPAALIVGRMSASEGYKGHEPLLHAWPAVMARHPEARLWIAGDGDDRRRLEALAEALGLGDVVLFTGRVPDAELDRLYRRCRFFVMPSLHEGFGLVFLEAMRARKACIGAPGAAAEIIQHGVTGFVVDPARPDDLVGALLRLFDDPQECERLGRAGAVRFADEFTDACFAARFAALLPYAG